MLIPLASAVRRSMSALFLSLMCILHAGCSHGSPSTCMGNRLSTITSQEGRCQQALDCCRSTTYLQHDSS
jgi:hypothetical protein